MKLIQDDTVIDSLVAAVMELQNRESTSLPLYEKQLRETETGIQNMLNAIQAGILTSSTKERLEALEAQKKDLEAKIAEEKLAKPVMKEEFVRFWLLHFRKLDLSQKEQRQALIDTFINAIYLYDDKVLITFNYKEGTETVSFDEAAEAAAKGKSSDIDCLGAPKNAVRPKGFAAFLFVRGWLHGFCTVGARFMFFVQDRAACEFLCSLCLNLHQFMRARQSCAFTAGSALFSKSSRADMEMAGSPAASGGCVSFSDSL